MENNQRISKNTALLANGIEGVDRALNGVALNLAMPSAYLGNHEHVAIAGMGRIDRNLSWGFGVSTSGDDYGGEIQARWAR